MTVNLDVVVVAGFADVTYAVAWFYQKLELGQVRKCHFESHYISIGLACLSLIATITALAALALPTVARIRNARLGYLKFSIIVIVDFSNVILYAKTSSLETCSKQNAAHT